MRSFLPSLWGGDDVRDPFLSMRRDLERVFEDFSRGVPDPWAGGGRAGPVIDVAETDDAVEVTAELPGVEEKDIEIDLSGDVLTVRGEKRHESEEKKKHHYRMERSYGSFSRSLKVPFDVDPDKVTASFDKGVLKVSLPKSPEVQRKSRKIRVKRG
jgi:HSP20 family protein